MANDHGRPRSPQQHWSEEIFKEGTRGHREKRDTKSPAHFAARGDSKADSCDSPDCGCGASPGKLPAMAPTIGMPPTGMCPPVGTTVSVPAVAKIDNPGCNHHSGRRVNNRGRGNHHRRCGCVYHGSRRRDDDCRGWCIHHGGRHIHGRGGNYNRRWRNNHRRWQRQANADAQMQPAGHRACHCSEEDC